MRNSRPAKRMLRGSQALCVLLACALAGCAAQGQPAAATPAYTLSDTAVLSVNGAWTPAAAPEGMEFVAQKGYSALFVNMQTGNLALEDMRNGVFYYSAPPDADKDPLAVGTYLSEMKSAILTKDYVPAKGTVEYKNSNDQVVQQNGLQVQKTSDGVQIWFKFMAEKYAIPVAYTLCEDGLRVQVISDKIVERGEARLLDISILPYFGAQTDDKDGYLLVPDGSGALIHFASQKQEYAAYNTKLYGDTYLTSKDYVANQQENSLLPMTGLQTPKGGYLAIADEGDAFGNVEAAVDGQNSSYNHTWFTFNLRSSQTSLIGNAQSFQARTVTVYQEGNIATGNISVRYVLLNSTPENGLSEMAAAARAYVVQQTKAFKPKELNSPFYVSVLAGFKKRVSTLGIRHDVTVPVDTVQMVGQMRTALAEQGVADAAFIYGGYDRNALNGKASATMRLDGKIGSNGEMAELIKTLGSGRLFLTLSPSAFTSGGGFASPGSSAIRDLTQSIFHLKKYQRNTFFPASDATNSWLLKPAKAADLVTRWLNNMNQRFPQAGVALDTYGSVLYADSSNSGMNRQVAEQLVSQTIQNAAEKYTVVCRNANYYAALSASAILDAPSSSSGYDLLDESVPFYQMVFAGPRQIIGRAYNLYGDQDDAILSCIRFGMVPQVELTMSDTSALKASGMETFYAAGFVKNAAQVSSLYARYRTLYEKIRGSVIADYQTISDGVSQTVYGNGVRVLVNSTEKAATGDGMTVGAKSFTVQNSAT